LIDVAVESLGFSYLPIKGYHFPNGPNVEYEITPSHLPIDKPKLSVDIEKMSNKIILENRKILCSIVESKDLEQEIRKSVPQKVIENNEPVRLVSIEGSKAVPCGGTHVTTTKEIGCITIRKIDISKNRLKIGYNVKD